MAYWIHTAGNKSDLLWRFFMCDYLSDVKNLPTAAKEGLLQPSDNVSSSKCSPGSQCLCQEDWSVWLLGKDTDQWVRRKAASSSGTPGEGEENRIEPIPPSSIQDLFPA